MTLQKITIIKIVNYIAQSEKTRDSKSNSIKKLQVLLNKTKTFHETKKIIKNIAAGGFGKLK